jgi:hypothetical protein
VKDILGNNVVGMVLARLNRLTQEEAQNAAAQTLETVYSLVQNTTVVMNGKQTHSAYKLQSPEQNFV